MEAEPAAKRLSEVGSVIDMAVVIYYMKPENSAKVLNSMDPQLTALITESLLK
jgi:flagellar motility protein MotE (MotC chaperone)